jgi:hypothetical protein
MSDLVQMEESKVNNKQPQASEIRYCLCVLGKTGGGKSTFLNTVTT